ncbi:MAG: hypothetical protein KJP16_02110 [Gammaproteobacteria bacterium]|nr:hypothetical protein [Gammaproteobacteria bacterium]NNL49583.1 hypothetical protein [Woeseiaceae bacterium]
MGQVNSAIDTNTGDALSSLLKQFDRDAKMQTCHRTTWLSVASKRSLFLHMTTHL